ncbi:MAG: hypothetical protein ACFFEY_05105 [Candidatus Thorarchaeota archaeon]
MNDKIKEKTKEELRISNKHFEKIVKISLIIGIVIVSGFIIYFLLTPEEGYVTYGILNENKEAGNYQKEASVNETIFFYITVGNYLNRDFKFQIKILKGDNTTVKSPNIPSNGSIDFIIGNFTLQHNEKWISGKLNTSFSEIGQDQIIIAELWQIQNEIEEYYDILWLQLNITN